MFYGEKVKRLFCSVFFSLSLHFCHDLSQRLDRFRFLMLESLETDTFDKLRKRSFPDLIRGSSVLVCLKGWWRFCATSLLGNIAFVTAILIFCKKTP